MFGFGKINESVIIKTEEAVQLRSFLNNKNEIPW